MKQLELLAPARTADIGIAAIDCGADAVYIAGPEFGARKDAGNALEDIARLCQHAHRYGARVFLTVNTILFESELERARQMMIEAQEAGVDAFIVQDQAVFAFEGINVPLHASTQCAIQTIDTARYYESLGAGRIVLERQMSLDTIRQISSSVDCEIEFFVHGALCVCYSGQCYMSELIEGRSANRGECIQACRSLYDLKDGSGRTLVRNKALLSLKDYNLKGRLSDLAEAGVTSFKIEGRLKNASYVKNVVRDYSLALDALVAAHPEEYCRASFGRVSGGFTPDSVKTFNRGYTELWIDGQRGQWSSMNAPKSMGEEVGRIASIRKAGQNEIELTLDLRKGIVLQNGDGFAKPLGGKSSGIVGFRADICLGNRIICKSNSDIHKGDVLFRNISAAFEKELDKNMPQREIAAQLFIKITGKFDIDITARTEDGREVWSPFKTDLDVAENRERAEAVLREQLCKRSLHYNFSIASLEVSTPGGALPFMSASTINQMRRLVAGDLDALAVKAKPLYGGKVDDSVLYPAPATYKANAANPLAQKVLATRGAAGVSAAFELKHLPGAELMRTRYCIRHELGMCPVHQGAQARGPLFLENNGRTFKADFDCAHCEMVISEVTPDSK